MNTAIKRTLGNTPYFIRYYWKSIVVIIALILVLFGGISFAAIDYSAKVAEVESGAKDPVLKLAYDYVDDILSPKVLSETGKLLEIGLDPSGNLTVGPYSVGAGNILNSIYNVSCGVAVLVLCISFLTDIAMMRQDNITEENVIRKLFMFVVGFLLIVKAMDITFTVAETGTWLSSRVTGETTFNITGNADALKESMWKASHTVDVALDSGQTLHWFEKVSQNMSDLGAQFGFVLQLFFPSLAMKLAWLITSVVCFSRAIELFLMCAFSPLAFMDSNTMDNLTNSPAWRFLKSVFAISIQGAVIVGAVAISGNIIGSIASASSASVAEFMEQSIQILIVIFAEVSLVTRSQGIAKSVLAIG